MKPKKALIVGHCHVNSPRLSQIVKQLGITPVRISSKDDLFKFLREDSDVLILVNRIFESTGEEGISVIEEVKALFPDTKVMLVSNYAESQDQAVQFGAIKGFGNASDDEKISDRIKATIEESLQEKDPSVF